MSGIPSGGPSIQQYLDARREAIETALARWLPEPPGCPPVIAGAVAYAVQAGGKRLRPILTLAAAEAAAREAVPPKEVRRLALPAACAIELIHTYSLVHDDLPAMDNDVMRRGRAPGVGGESDGLPRHAGDGLQKQAISLLAREPSDTEGRLAARKLRTIHLIADAAGLRGMVGGQAVDLALSGLNVGAAPSPERPGMDMLKDMHARKTGALIRAAAVAGAVMVGAPDEVIAGLEAYATDLGLAFQIIDDILDVEGETTTLGKTAGKDAAAGKLTYPALAGVEPSRALARDAIARAERALDAAAIDATYLRAIARWAVRRTG